MNRQAYLNKFCKVRLKATSFYTDAIQYHISFSQSSTKLHEM